MKPATQHITFTARESSIEILWKRLAGRIIIRAVLDIINEAISEDDTSDPRQFLTDRQVRQWSDAWDLSVPWRKIDELTQKG